MCYPRLIETSLISALFVLLTGVLFGQTISEEFHSGDTGFRTQLQASLTYPKRAIDSCQMGLSRVEFTVDQAGVLQSYSIRNSVSHAVDSVVVQFLTETSGKWKLGAVRKLSLEIAFQISYEAKIIGEYSIIGHHFQGTTAICGSNEALENAFRKTMKAGQLADARSHVQELLRRDPDNALYQQFLTLIP